MASDAGFVSVDHGVCNHAKILMRLQICVAKSSISSGDLNGYASSKVQPGFWGWQSRNIEQVRTAAHTNCEHTLYVLLTLSA